MQTQLIGLDIVALAREAGVSYATAQRRAKGKSVNSSNERRLVESARKLGLELPPAQKRAA